MFALQELPELVDGGEDESQIEEPVEEEFDLADILGEEVSGSGSKEELLKKVEEELKVCLVQLCAFSLTCFSFSCEVDLQPCACLSFQ